MLAACVTRTETFYVSPRGADRITEDEFRDRLNALLHVECPRLLGDRPSAAGDTKLALDVARGGVVSRVRLAESSGDARLDDIFGGLAATLRLDPADRRGDPAGLTISYSCSPTSAAAVVTRTR